LQSQYNRYNSSNPFGSSSWSTDPNGHETLTQAPNERTQSAIDRAFTSAETPYQQEYIPQGMNQLASAIMGRVGARYGLGDANPNNPSIWADHGAAQGGQGGALNTNLKQQQQSPPPPNLGNVNITQPSPPMQQRTMGV
jgi:hypothetical protein